MQNESLKSIVEHEALGTISPFPHIKYNNNFIINNNCFLQLCC
jgi:hypothetical protein